MSINQARLFFSFFKADDFEAEDDVFTIYTQPDDFNEVVAKLGNYSFVSAQTDLEGNEKFMVKSIMLPEGKKPVMLTETMVNYFAYMVDGDGDGKRRAVSSRR